ncbi:MAG: hypothetical protein R6V10_13935 [bacterium]
MKPKPINRSAAEEKGSIVVQTTLYDLVSAVEREMEGDSDNEVAKAVSGMLEKRRPRKPWKAMRNSGCLLPLEKADG